MHYFKNILFLATLSLLPFLSTHAQTSLKNKFWIGIDVQRSIPDVLSSTNRRFPAFPRSIPSDTTFLNSSSIFEEQLIVGGVIAYGLSDILQIQTGAYLRSFKVEWENAITIADVEIPEENSRFWDGSDDPLVSITYQTLQIPLRFRLSQPVSETRFSVFADLGYILGIHLSESPIPRPAPGITTLHGTTQITPSDTSISYSGAYGVQFPRSRLYHLIEAGVGVRYELTERLMALFNISYSHGVGRETRITSILSSENTVAQTNVRTTSHGYYGVTVGVRYGLFDE